MNEFSSNYESFRYGISDKRSALLLPHMDLVQRPDFVVDVGFVRLSTYQ